MHVGLINEFKIKLLCFVSVLALVISGFVGVFVIVPETVIADTELNDSVLTAETISTGVPISGEINDTDTIDWYNVSIPPGSIINVTYSSDALFTQNLYFYNPSQITIMSLSSSSNIEDSDEHYLAKETATDYWSILISTSLSGYGNYTFTITLKKQNDGGSADDVAGDFTGAYEVNKDTQIVGHLGDLDLVDMYKIHLENVSTINVTFTSSSSINSILNIYRPDELYVFNVASGNNIETTDEYNVGTLYPPGYWYFKVSNNYDCDYTFTITIELMDLTPPKIFNVTIEPSTYVVSISWETDVDTNGTVFYGLDTNYASYVIATTINYDTMHTVYIYDAVQGKKYFFKISSYNEIGVKNDIYLGTFKQPRSTFIESQYNALKTLIFAKLKGQSQGSTMDFSVYCFDKGVAVTPDSIAITSATDDTNLSFTNPETGVYTGTYTINKDDVDVQEVTLFADVSYQGDNDTSIFTADLSASEEIDDWDVSIDYISPTDREASFGDTINLKIVTTKNGKKADPENLTVYVYENQESRQFGNQELTSVKIGTGDYEVSYTFPTAGNDSKSFEFEAQIMQGEESSWDYLSHALHIFYVWYKQLSITNKSADYDVYITDLEYTLIPNAVIEIALQYYNSIYELKGNTQNKTTDANGKANFKFNYPDNGQGYFDVYGKVTASGKTQMFEGYESIPGDTIIDDLEPYGSLLEILPQSSSSETLIASPYYASPDATGNVKKDFTVYSNSEPLNDTEIYYYILAGTTIYYPSFMSNEGDYEVLKTGVGTTDGNGNLTLDFKVPTTRSTSDLDFISVLIECIMGPFGTIEPYSMVTSRDGNYYAESSTQVYILDSSSVTTLEDLVSSNIKITIPKLNRGTPTNVEVSYSGTIPNPLVMVTIFPGEVLVDTNLMDFNSPWGAWVDPEDSYLTQSNGAYTGTFTIPSFITGNTFTIVAVVENIDAYVGSIESTLYSDFVKINMVVLDVGDSVKDGGIGGKVEPKPQPSEIDSDGDGFTDAEETGFGTDPQDTYEFPGSEEGDVYEEKKVESADVKVLAETEGEVTIEGIAPVNAPDVPKEIGQSLGIFINITADKNATNIKIVIYLGEIGGDIIPANADPKGIKLFYYDEDTKQWVEVKGSSFDKNTGLLTATIDHLTVFSAMSTKASEKGGGGDDDAGMQNIIIIIVVIIVVVILLGIFGVIAKRKGKSKGPEASGTEERVTPESEPRGDEEHALKDEDEDYMEPQKKPEEEPQEEPSKEPKEEVEDKPPEEPSDEVPEEGEKPQPPKIVKPGSQAEEPTTSEPEPEEPEETKEEPKKPETSEPEQKEPENEEPVQQVPCPTCGKDIAVYSTPCSNCGQHLNW